MPTFGERFGALIRGKREDRGWSYAQLAVAAFGDDGAGGETRKSDAQKVELGKSAKPTARTIKRFREALGLTQAEIDACRTPEEIELARFAKQLFAVIADAVAQSDVSDALALELTDRYAAGNTDDFDGALRGLRRALHVAAEDRARGRLPSNTLDAVDQVIAKMDALNDAGQVDQAEAELQTAIRASEDREAQEKSARLRLHGKGIAQAILTRSVDNAVIHELARLALDHPDPATRFDPLRKARRDWYERGRDKGLNFDLRVAIGLARESRAIAVGPDQIVAALNNLGTALKTLGARDSDPDTLHQAVTAYREALKEHTRERVPLDWAMTQNNLGVALKTLGERDRDPDTLHQAVTAHRAALKEYTRERDQLDWATTQNNLGNALKTLGERDSDPGTLHRAITAYREALKEYTRERVPLDWAGTQNNLGIALKTLGERDRDPDILHQAVTAYREALKEYTRERVPLDWAATQNNLGNSLRILGARDRDPDILHQAVTAFREALKEWTRERVPLNWAFTLGNLCNLELAFFDLSARPDHLDRAQSCLDGAREVFQQAGASQYLAVADHLQSEIDRHRAALQG